MEVLIKNSIGHLLDVLKRDNLSTKSILSLSYFLDNVSFVDMFRLGEDWQTFLSVDL